MVSNQSCSIDGGNKCYMRKKGKNLYKKFIVVNYSPRNRP